MVSVLYTKNWIPSLLLFYFSHRIPVELGGVEPGSLKVLCDLLMAAKRILNTSLGCANADGEGDSRHCETSIPKVPRASSHEVEPSHTKCLNETLARNF